MGEKILSQDEVEALIKGVNEGDVDTEAAEAPASGVRGYDLTSQDRIIRGRMPSLEIINERFARLFRVSISSLLRKEAEISPVSVDIVKFGEFARMIPLPSSINVIKMDPLRGHILIVLDAKGVYRMVDLYFGGQGQTYVKVEGRDFTTVEQRIIQRVIGMLLEDYQKAWSPLHRIKVVFVRSEINPQFAAVVAPTEVVVKVVFRMELEGEGCDIFICLPYPTIEPIRDKLYGGFQSDQLEVDGQWGVRFRSQLGGCLLNVTAEVGEASLTLDEVIHLSEGDIILLDKNINEDLTMKVEGRPKFSGRAGTHQGNPAFQITSLVQDH